MYYHITHNVGLKQKLKWILNLLFFMTKNKSPIYALGCKKFLTTQEIMNVLLDSDLNLKPFGVASNAVFII